MLQQRPVLRFLHSQLLAFWDFQREEFLRSLPLVTSETEIYCTIISPNKKKTPHKAGSILQHIFN
jgi:hypothetical protein